jgi:hypothetical protein
MKNPEIIIIIFCTILFSCCQRDKSLTGDGVQQQIEIGYLHFNDYGCSNNEGIFRSAGDSAYLKKFHYHNDTLTLTFHFNANCCPAFIDSIAISGNSVDIALTDTLSGCRCICPFDDDFMFYFRGQGKLNIQFMTKDRTSQKYVSLVDTVIFIEP